MKKIFFSLFKAGLALSSGFRLPGTHGQNRRFFDSASSHGACA